MLNAFIQCSIFFYIFVWNYISIEIRKTLNSDQYAWKYLFSVRKCEFRLFSRIVVATSFRPWWIILLTMHAIATSSLTSIGACTYAVVSNTSLNFNQRRNDLNNDVLDRKSFKHLPALNAPIASTAKMKNTNVTFILIWIENTSKSFGEREWSQYCLYATWSDELI